MLNTDLEREYITEYMFILEEQKEKEIKFWEEQKKLPALIKVKIENHERNIEPSGTTV